MSKWFVEERRTYIADAEALKERFPEEYDDFVERSGGDDTDDELWVIDCIDSGGFELLELQDAEYDMVPK